MTKKKERKKKKRKLSCHYRCNQAGITEDIPTINKNLINLFESLPHVLANSRENNTNKSYMNYCIEWQKWENQFREVIATPVEEIYVILYMLSLF